MDDDRWSRMVTRQALKKLIEDSHRREVERKKIEYKILGLDPENSPQAIETFYILQRDHDAALKKLAAADEADCKPTTLPWKSEV